MRHGSHELRFISVTVLLCACGVDSRDVSAPVGERDAGAGGSGATVAEGLRPGDPGGIDDLGLGGRASLAPDDFGDGRISLSGAGGSSSPDAGGADVVPPSVVSVTPSRGTSQVTSELVSVQFSEAMDRASVESALQDARGFVWSEDSSAVTFRLPLPFDAEPRLFDIVMPGSVEDSAGNPLGEDVVTSIVLAALARVTLPFDGALSGNQIAGDDGNYTFFEAGDTAGGLLRYGAASFALAELPAFGSVRALRQATLHLQVSNVEGNPSDPAFEGFLIDRIALQSRPDIDAPTILEPAFARLLVPPEVSAGRVVRLDVTAQLAAVWSAGDAHLQIRIAPRASNLDNVTDTLFLRRGANENDSVVDLESVPEPDPDNVARVELEYFR